MNKLVIILASESPYSQSRAHETAKESANESADAYDARTWREHMHVNDAGQVYLPPMALKKSIEEAAQFRGERIPGKGQATYSKHFMAGVMIMDPILLVSKATGKPIMRDDVPCDRLYLNADGKKGSGSRVWRRYPRIDNWTGNATLYVVDDVLTEDVVLKFIREAGMFIGAGRFRPRNGGFYGRFSVLKHVWHKNWSMAA